MRLITATTLCSPLTARGTMLALTKWRPALPQQQPTWQQPSKSINFSTTSTHLASQHPSAAQQAPKTYAAQDVLPRLPVPSLEQTLPSYLASLAPLLAQMEEFGELPASPAGSGTSSAASELSKRSAWVEEMLAAGSMGARLQQRLLDVDATTPHNWLDDRFWLVKAYHEWRVPLLVNSNWWLLFTNDQGLGATEDQVNHSGQIGPDETWSRTTLDQLRAQAEHAPRAWPVSSLLGPTPAGAWDEALALGIRRASWLAWRMVELKLRLDRQDVPPDASRSATFCMHQYANVYGVTRIPSLPHDFNTRPADVEPRYLDSTGAGLKTTAAKEPPARHLTIIVRNHYYSLTVIDESGLIVSPQALYDGMQSIVEDVEQRISRTTPHDVDESISGPGPAGAEGDGEGVGVLTADERDRWAVNREHLLAIDPETNGSTLRSIERSLFAVSIDTSILPLPFGHPPPISGGSTPAWVDALARNVCGAGRGAQNRWFDKSMNLVVEPNGRAGINGEHSPVDALIPSIIADYATGVPCTPIGTKFPDVSSSTPDELISPGGGVATFSRLDWRLDDKIRAEMQDATARALSVGCDADVRVLYYDKYSADWIKKVARQSPDAFLQQALQVAMALTYGRQTPTYETASTRVFKHGRTDVIRSFSLDSYQFVKALLRPNGTKMRKWAIGEMGHQEAQKLYALLSKATQSHNSQTRQASMGQGVDRHLTGLRLVYNPQTDDVDTADSKNLSAATTGVGGMPQLLTDDLFAKSQTWTLSTSGLSAGDRLAGTGFGAGYADGYGCNCTFLFPCPC